MIIYKIIIKSSNLNLIENNNFNNKACIVIWKKKINKNNNKIVN